MAVRLDDFEVREKKIFIFRKKEILVKKDSHELPDKNFFDLLVEKKALKLQFYDSCTDAVGAELCEDFEKKLENYAEGYVMILLRQYFFENDESEAGLSARMMGYVNWLDDNKFCSFCGNPLEMHQWENALYCRKCGKIHYPRVEPCIIVLVHKEDKILLLRHTYRNQDKFTCLAGFMELGESAEQCVRREVREEVGLEIKNIRYKGSQGWPFPDQLMLAFYADYESGEIRLQESEIAEAEWFSYKNLPNIMPEGTVAWKLMFDKF